jgi:hypothetical protein
MELSNPNPVVHAPKSITKSTTTYNSDKLDSIDIFGKNNHKTTANW